MKTGWENERQWTFLHSGRRMTEVVWEFQGKLRRVWVVPEMSLFIHRKGIPVLYRSWRKGLCNHGRTPRTEDIWGGGAVDIVPGSSCSLLHGRGTLEQTNRFSDSFPGHGFDEAESRGLMASPAQ